MKESAFEIENIDTILEELTKSNCYRNEKINISKNSKCNTIAANYNHEYIGILSDNFKTREEIGMNIYKGSDNICKWYYGEWKNNFKEGIGFSRLCNDEFYFGNWKAGKFEGKGIYFWFSNSDIDKMNQDTILNTLAYQVFIGDIENNEKKKGLYLMNEVVKDKIITVGYMGKIINNRKKDDDCLLIEFNNQRVYRGRIENDEMIDGYYLNFINNSTNGSLSSNMMFKFNKNDTGSHDFVIESQIKDNKKIKEEILNQVGNVIKMFNDLNTSFSKFIEMIILKYSCFNTLSYYSNPDGLSEELLQVYNSFNIQ